VTEAGEAIFFLLFPFLQKENPHSKTFALIGAAGYVAPRHMKAIKDTGNTLMAAMDPNDSVGVIDSFFPNADFFTEFERFDRYIDKLRRQQNKSAVDYISVCSPNYLHDSHIRFALRSNANAICEKPVVLNHWNIDALAAIEKETGNKVYTVLQLRLHSSIIELKAEVDKTLDKKYDVILTYITSRGKWYWHSWKGDIKKSGGIATNIGVHFFDMLHFVFGNVQENVLHYQDEYKAGGFIEYEKARVKWFLSVDEQDLPGNIKDQEKRIYRSLTVNGKEVEFSDGFADLHTKTYEAILAGNGFELEENRVAIETAGTIRTQSAAGLVGEFHPLLKHIS
jgi:UDP-N-acetyl-2-amino-2-deoxyglucuronate dehydrogenase